MSNCYFLNDWYTYVKRKLKIIVYSVDLLWRINGIQINVTIKGNHQSWPKHNNYLFFHTKVLRLAFFAVSVHLVCVSMRSRKRAFPRRRRLRRYQMCGRTWRHPAPPPATRLTAPHPALPCVFPEIAHQKRTSAPPRISTSLLHSSMPSSWRARESLWRCLKFYLSVIVARYFSAVFRT